jgi:hypothetical protein
MCAVCQIYVQYGKYVCNMANICAVWHICVQYGNMCAVWQKCVQYDKYVCSMTNMCAVWQICVQYDKYVGSMTNMCVAWQICVQYGKYVCSMAVTVLGLSKHTYHIFCLLNFKFKLSVNWKMYHECQAERLADSWRILITHLVSSNSSLLYKTRCSCTETGNKYKWLILDGNISFFKDCWGLKQT